MASSSIGSTRNLTQQFIRYRNDAKRLRIPDATEDRATAKLLGAALGSSSDGGDIELGRVAPSYAPRWVAAAEKIKGEMAVLKDRIAKLREYHGRALLVSFDDAGGTGEHVDALTREIQLAFRRLDGLIRALPGGSGGGGGDDGGDVRLQVQRQLAQALFKLSVEFRKEETRFLNKMEAQRGYEKGSIMGLVEDERPGVTGDGGGGGGGFTQAQLLRASQAESLIEERDVEIKKVVETIVELAQIMRDLSTLVVEQGTMLDRIDANITETAVRVEGGVKELVRAERLQKSSRATTCIVVLLILIFIFLVIAIVRHT